MNTNLDTSNRVLSISGSHGINRTNFDVDYLNLSHVSLQSLPRGFSVFFSNLRVYSLSSIEPKKIQRADFKEFPKLKVLDFYHVNIFEPPDDLLRDLKLLEVVLFQSCNMRKIPDIFFSNQRNLKVVNLERNYLKRLSLTLFFNNQQLISLRLRTNAFEDIPTELLKRFENIKTVSLDEDVWLIGSDKSSKDCESNLMNHQCNH